MSKTRRSAEFKNQSRVIDMEEARAQRQAKRQAQMKKRKRSEKQNKGNESRGKRAIRRKRNRTRLFMAFVVLLLIIGLIAAGLHVGTLVAEKNRVQEEQAELQAQKQRLEEQLEEADNAQAIEDEARAELRFVRAGEVLYMFSEDFNGAVDQMQENGEIQQTEPQQ